ncbi:MAG: hypothetical protein K8R79_02000 [Calditrichales bacterium]|nr:hypothetical protein [Calditrichales bacterium]
MRYIFLVFFILTFCKAQNQQYWLHFDYNAPTDSVTHYNLFLVEMSDTTLTPFHEGDSASWIRAYQINTFSEDLLKANNPDTGKVDFIDIVNGLYIQCALSATNKNGESLIGISNCYRKENLMLPCKPVIMSIIKGD